MKKIFMSLLLVAGMFFGASVFAQANVADGDVQSALAELRAEIKSLRVSVADMKAQLDAVRLELRAAKTPADFTQEPLVFPGNVRDIQALLKDFPDVYPEGLVTGYYGDLTKKAIRKFQEKYGNDTNDERIRDVYRLLFPATPLIPPAIVASSSADVSGRQTVAVATTSAPLPMQQTPCPALPTVSACATGEERIVSYSSAACGTYYSCVPKGIIIATSTATSTSGFASWRRITWGKGGSSLVGPGVSQETIDARIALIASTCPDAAYYDYANPSDASKPNAGVSSCPSATSTVASGGCARYGSGWHSMDASGKCFDGAMQNYRDADGKSFSCSSTSVSGCSGSTSYPGDANSCPGFAYSRWDSQGKRYCQLNSVRSCDYNYPGYLTNGANYKPENCPTSDSSGASSYAYASAFNPQFAEPAGGCGQYGSLTKPMQWVLHGNAVGGSCVSGTRPLNTITECPSGRWPTWDSNGWPVGCSNSPSGNTITATSSVSTTATATATTNTVSTGNTGTTNSVSQSGSTSQTYSSSGGSMSSSSGGTYGSCSSALIGLLGSGCHYMYNDTAGQPIYCDGSMTNSAKDRDTAATSGCTGTPLGGTYSYGSNYSDATSYPGDANSCPGFAYSRWDSQGKRYCQLNSVRSCDYNYPGYLTNGANYKPENCPATDSSYGSYSGGSWSSGSGSGGCRSYISQTSCGSASGCVWYENHYDGSHCDDQAHGQSSGGSTYYNSSSTGSSSCGSEFIALLGSGCHNMSNAYFNSEMNRYILPGMTTAKECSAEYVSGCSGSSYNSTSTSMSSDQERYLAATLATARSILEAMLSAISR